MTEEIVKKICNEVFHTQPTEIIRNNVGLAGYVYTVQINDEKYVVKISDDKNLISGSTYWLNKVKGYRQNNYEILSKIHLYILPIACYNLSYE